MTLVSIDGLAQTRPAANRFFSSRNIQDEGKQTYFYYVASPNAAEIVSSVSKEYDSHMHNLEEGFLENGNLHHMVHNMKTLADRLGIHAEVKKFQDIPPVFRIDMTPSDRDKIRDAYIRYSGIFDVKEYTPRMFNIVQHIVHASFEMSEFSYADG